LQLYGSTIKAITIKIDIENMTLPQQARSATKMDTLGMPKNTLNGFRLVGLLVMPSEAVNCPSQIL
jgi:hypothetical protein